MMAWQQLVVHENEDVGEVVTEALATALGPQNNVIRERNFARALKQLDAPDAMWSLVVISGSAPQSHTTRGDPGGAPARAFVRELKASHPQLPLIAIVNEQDSELAGLLSAFPDTVLMPCSLDFRDKLEGFARVLAQGGEQAQGSVLELEIALHDTNIGMCTLRRTGRINEKLTGMLVLDPDKFRALRAADPSVGQWPSFLGWMDDMSLRIKEYLVKGSNSSNFELWSAFYRWRAEVGGTENTRIRFMLPTEAQDLMVEAMKDSPGNDYWMLKAPIVRQYNSAGSTPALFSSEASRRERINCLVIDADPDAGEIDEAPWKCRLEELKQSRKEAESVVRILQAGSAEHGIGKVRRLELRRRDDDLQRTVTEALSSDRWHLVHFIGHGVVGRNGAAGLVLAATPGGVLNFAELTARLPHTQFLFISSCRSANTAFLTHATRSQVPAALGYRWPVADAAARHFAERFYEALLKPGTKGYKSLEYAFLRSRQDAWNEAAEDVTWASPLLLTQLQ
jgi:hypothetical protein